MAATLLTLDAAKGVNIGVVEDDSGAQAVHDVVTAMRANRRSGTANTKTRGEVKASNKKPWRQKGTGRARAGRVSSPIWRGGGVVFGPRPRSYAKDVNKRTRRLAFRKALSERINEGSVFTADGFAVADGKTKSFVSQVGSLGVAEGKVLIVSDTFDEKTYLAGRNIQWAQLVRADDVNTEELLYFDKIIVTNSALEALAERTN